MCAKKDKEKARQAANVEISQNLLDIADHTSKSPVSDPSSTPTRSLSCSTSPISTTLTTDNKKQPLSSAEYMNFESVHTPLVRRSYSDPQQFNSSGFSEQLESDEIFSCSSSFSCSPSPPFSWPRTYGNSYVYERSPTPSSVSTLCSGTEVHCLA